MKKLITICAVAGFIMTVIGTAQAELDIEGIYMTSCKDHLDGTAYTDPWCFEVWVDFADEGDLDHIDVTMTGGLSSFTIYGDDWEYESLTDYSSLAALQTDYPTGNYTFDFIGTGGTPLNSIVLDYSGLSEPGNPVDFNYPSYDGQTGIDINPTFNWTINPNDGDALGMWVWDPNAEEDVYGNAPASMDTLDWTPGPLLPSREYGLEVSVFEAKNPQPGPTLPTMTVGGDTFAYGLLIEYCNEIEFTTVPEPTTICLLGLGGLLFSRSRKLNKK